MNILILDKDGTLVSPESGAKFVSNPEDQRLMPGVAERLQEYKNAGWIVAIASNQGGVASGHKTLESAIYEMYFAMRLTGIKFAMIAPSYEEQQGEAVYLRYDGAESRYLSTPIRHPDQRFRKPNPGMILWLTANLRYEFDLRVLFVGDRDEDRQAAENAGVTFMPAAPWRTSSL